MNSPPSQSARFARSLTLLSAVCACVCVGVAETFYCCRARLFPLLSFQVPHSRIQQDQAHPGFRDRARCPARDGHAHGPAAKVFERGKVDGYYSAVPLLLVLVLLVFVLVLLLLLAASFSLCLACVSFVAISHQKVHYL